jgi:hypothetical protein
VTNKIGTREEAEKVCIYWACDEPEKLICTTPNDAIESYLEGVEKPPETVHLAGYTRMPVAFSGSPLDYVLERLDEDHGDPDGVPDDPTEKMKAAEAAFIAAVLAEYKGHWCEDVYHEDVNARGWLAEHDPEWLKEFEGPA